MSFHYSPKLLTDKLKMCLDGGNTKSYSIGDTVWKDISNYRNDATLFGGVTYNSSFGGVLEFDGTTGYSQSTTLTTLLDGSEDFTIQMFFYPTNMTAGTLTTLFDTVGRNLSLWVGENINNQFWGMGGNDAFYNLTDFNWENNKWQMATMKKEGSTGYIIKNSNEFTYTITPGLNYSNQLVFGTNPSGGSPIANFKGYIGLIVFYNKSLSDLEISNNFRALKYRFKLWV
jgi:hypothetical protein